MAKSAENIQHERSDRWTIVRRYLAFLFLANLLWEFAHMPLYAAWKEGGWADIAYNGFHCTVGDLMIGASALFLGVHVAGGLVWPNNNRTRLAIVTILFGLCYTVFSKWVNVYVRDSWSYSELMPLLPGIGIGFSPIAQWLVLPVLGFSIAYRSNYVTEN